MSSSFSVRSSCFSFLSIESRSTQTLTLSSSSFSPAFCSSFFSSCPHSRNILLHHRRKQTFLLHGNLSTKRLLLAVLHFCGTCGGVKKNKRKATHRQSNSRDKKKQKKTQKKTTPHTPRCTTYTRNKTTRIFFIQFPSVFSFFSGLHPSASCQCLSRVFSLSKPHVWTKRRRKRCRLSVSPSSFLSRTSDQNHGHKPAQAHRERKKLKKESFLWEEGGKSETKEQERPAKEREKAGKQFEESSSVSPRRNPPSPTLSSSLASLQGRKKEIFPALPLTGRGKSFLLPRRREKGRGREKERAAKQTEGWMDRDTQRESEIAREVDRG